MTTNSMEEDLRYEISKTIIETGLYVVADGGDTDDDDFHIYTIGRHEHGEPEFVSLLSRQDEAESVAVMFRQLHDQWIRGSAIAPKQIISHDTDGAVIDYLTAEASTDEPDTYATDWALQAARYYGAAPKLLIIDRIDRIKEQMEGTTAEA